MSFWVEGVNGIVVQQDSDDQDDPDFHDGWAKVPVKYRMQISNGIGLARAMTACALKGLDMWSACLRGDGDLALAAEVDDALHKYFRISRQDLDKRVDGSVARGIRRVLQQVHDGLEDREQCAIQLWSFVKPRVWAGVMEVGGTKAGTQPSPIRATFGYADEHGHVEWRDMGGPILLSTAWLKRPEESAHYTKAEEIARTLVHEASHRFAGTRDILYKAESLGEELKAMDKVFSDRVKQPGETQAEFVNDRILNKQLLQQASAGASTTTRAPRPGGVEKLRAVGIPKDLVSMAPKVGKPPIDDVRWLENADSYAFFARRVWKRYAARS